MTTTSTKTIARLAARLAAGAFLSLAAVNAANAAGCPEWICGDNGTQLDGLRLEGLQQPRIDGAAGGCFKWICGENGTQLDGLRLEGLQQPRIDGTAGGCQKWMCGENGTQLDGIRPEALQQPVIVQPAGNVRSQAEKRLEQQRKDLTRNWGG